ncbi:MAG: DUF368 domain-containing protein [Bacteroidia bacterium]|nr:DUF368 domain-containing protein [Bacteroidales bacterium]NCD40472.1 DUF368 domain-containing protein [Bacteroidia bacterium]MDD2322084.1 DUF368 domain-containing protein [Bacteroidales bacterium]MDD3011495.1 DUF368 domain-containing protein [Bacteroidales bacterium]MDD3961614.1 DUF368 domain-containing protein [Bacteroidales bacterium]
MKEYLGTLAKGIAMGAANVIPGVSGGTIALITGIFERLILAIKSFNLKAIRLIFTGKFREFIRYTDLYFLLAVAVGILLAAITLARVFDYLFTHYPVYIWAYFFGLVLASVYFVGRTVKKWNLPVLISFITGTGIAVLITVLNPATENSSFFYLVICGIAGICSMILPGLSGSFILFIMGNYQLIIIDAVNHLDMGILFPVILGAVGGLMLFSHLLSWVLKHYKNQTIALLTGFILGSLRILWPWQKKILLLDVHQMPVLKNGEPVIVRYQQFIPEHLTGEVLMAALWILVGIASITLIEYLAAKSITEESY